MNKLSLFSLLIFVYLGLAKSFSPSDYKAQFINNELALGNLSESRPLSIILEGKFKTGFFIKTYFLKLKIVHGFKRPQYIIIRTPYNFWEKNLNNIGMSLFRRSDNGEKSITPAPPGTLFIGDLSYGHWRLNDSGNKSWRFYRAYREFPKFFNWGKFRPSQTFYNQSQTALKSNKVFYGRNEEFGTNGSITKLFPNLYVDPFKRPHELDFRMFLKKFLSIPISKENAK